MRISDWGSDGCSSDLGCASGAGVAGTSRRRSLSRLASDCRARERPRRSEKTPLYLLATGLDRPCYFGRRKDRLPRTALPLRLARGHQRAAPDRGRVSFEEVARRHPAYASTMLFGHRLVARDCHKSILATSARPDWRLARAPSSTGYGDIALRAAKCQIGRATSELQSLMRNSYAVFCLKKKTTHTKQTNITHTKQNQPHKT